MSDISPTPSSPQSVPPADGSTAQKALPKKRRRRWWLRALVALPVLLVLLVLLAPTILNLGFVRSMILPKISSAVAPHGKLDISSWRFGWFSGQEINGVRLLDDQNAVVAHLNIKTQASLWSLMRGNYNIGDTVVNADFDLRVNPATGDVNALRIVGVEKGEEPSPKADDAPAAKSEPAKKDDWKPDDELPIDLSKVKGKLTVNLSGTISASNGDSRSLPFTKLNNGLLVVDLNDIERGVGIDLRLPMTIGEKPALLTVKGTADAVEKNLIVTDPNAISADLVAGVEQLDLAIVKIALAAMGIEDIDMGGMLKGRLVVDVKPGGAGSIRAEDGLGIDNFYATAPQLKGDTFTSQRIDFPLNVSRAAGSDEIRIEALSVKTDVASVGVAGVLSQKALQNVAAGRAPGATSQLKTQASIPSFAAVTTMLPHVMRLQEGVQITGGGLAHTATFELIADGAKVSQTLELDATGTSAGKPIRMEKVKLDAGADVALRDDAGVDLKSIRSLAMTLVAPFARIEGGGVPEKIQLAGNVDLTRFYADVSQFVDMGELDLKGTANFNFATSGVPTAGSTEPVGLTLGFDARGLVVTNNGEGLLNNENIKGDVNLLLKQTADANTITFRKLNIAAESGLFGVWTTGDDAWVSVFKNGAFGGEGEFKLRAKLERLASTFATSVDPSMQLKRGLLDGSVQLASDATKNEYKVVSDFTLSRLDVGELLADETLRFGTTTFVPGAFDAIRTWYEVASSFVSVKGEADVKLAAANGGSLTPFEMLRSATFDGQIPSLPKLHALASSLSPAAPAVDAQGQPLPPLKVESGSVAFSGKVSRDDAKRTTTIALNVPGISRLVLSRGTQTFRQDEPITLALAADLVTDSSKATVGEQLQRIVVSKLEANVPGIASLTMPQAIELADLDKPAKSAKGTIRAEALLEPLGQMLAVLNGGEPMPVRGTLTTEQRITTSGESTIALTGTGRVNDIRPTGPGAQPLPDRLQTIELANDLSVDTKAMAATIKRLDVVAPDARDVLALGMSGRIRELGTRNAFDDLQAKVAYDLAQLWPLLQPFVDPTGETIGRVEGLAGKYEKTFRIGGSFPTADAKGNVIAFNDSVRNLDIVGDLQIDRANLVDKGVEIENLSIPIAMNNGVARIAYADGKLPKPFKVNHGEGSLAGLAVDLTTAEPTLGNVKNHKLITNATINPVLSNALGKFFNPIFPNATKATGLVSVMLSAERLRLGPALMTPQGGKATVVINLTEMEISNPLGEQMFGGLLNQAAAVFDRGGINTASFNNFNGEMRNATFTLDRGILKQDATFMIGSVDESPSDARSPALYPFRFSGDVRLADLTMDLTASLPLQLVKEKARGDFAKVLEFMPDALPINFSGKTTAVRIGFSRDIGQLFARAGLKYGAQRALGGDGAGADIIGSDGKIDLGGVIDNIRDREKKDEPKRDEPRRDEAKRDEAKRDEAKRDERPREPDPAEAKKDDDKPTKAQQAREAKAREEAEAKRRADEQSKAEAADRQTKAQKAREARAREEAEAKAREEAEAKRKEEEQRNADAADRPTKAQRAREAKAREEAEAKAREEAKRKEEEQRKADSDKPTKAQKAREAKAREEAEARAREEAKRKEEERRKAEDQPKRR